MAGLTERAEPTCPHAATRVASVAAPIDQARATFEVLREAVATHATTEHAGAASKCPSRVILREPAGVLHHVAAPGSGRWLYWLPTASGWTSNPKVVPVSPST